jgi:hypothetical protein
MGGFTQESVAEPPANQARNIAARLLARLGKPQDGVPSRRAMQLLWAGLLLVGPLPLLLKLGWSLWEREQYQFFPIKLIGAAIVAWDRWQEVRPIAKQRGSFGVAMIFIFAGLAVLVGGSAAVDTTRVRRCQWRAVVHCRIRRPWLAAVRGYREISCGISLEWRASAV